MDGSVLSNSILRHVDTASERSPAKQLGLIAREIDHLVEARSRVKRFTHSQICANIERFHVDVARRKYDEVSLRFAQSNQIVDYEDLGEWREILFVVEFEKLGVL